MGFLDKAKDAAKKAVDEHGDKISSAADKAAEFADNKTDGKHADKIAKGRLKLDEAIEKLDKPDGRP